MDSQKDTKIRAGNATLELINSYLKHERPNNVLELGGGKGTISELILTRSNAMLDIYEHKELYQEELRKNLQTWGKRITIIPSYYILPPKREYDLIIVDGGGIGTIDESDFPQAIGLFIRSLHSVKTIIIEGQRKRQKHYILEVLKSRYIYKATHLPDPLGGKKISVRIDCTPCKNPLKRYWNHFVTRRNIVKKLALSPR